MRNKVLLFFFLSLFFSLLFIIVNSIVTKKREINSIQTLPYFEFQCLDGSINNTLFFNKGRNTLIIYFNSECYSCDYQTTILKNNMNLFSNFDIIFISQENIDAIASFSYKHNLLHDKNVYFISDYKKNIANLLHINSYPYLFFYDSSLSLKYKHKGFISIERIMANIENY